MQEKVEYYSVIVLKSPETKYQLNNATYNHS